jgi:hypothetical protein
MTQTVGRRSVDPAASLASFFTQRSKRNGEIVEVHAREVFSDTMELSAFELTIQVLGLVKQAPSPMVLSFSIVGQQHKPVFNDLLLIHSIPVRASVSSTTVSALPTPSPRARSRKSRTIRPATRSVPTPRRRCTDGRARRPPHAIADSQRLGCGGPARPPRAGAPSMRPPFSSRQSRPLLRVHRRHHRAAAATPLPRRDLPRPCHAAAALQPCRPG